MLRFILAYPVELFIRQKRIQTSATLYQLNNSLEITATQKPQESSKVFIDNSTGERTALPKWDAGKSTLLAVHNVPILYHTYYDCLYTPAKGNTDGVITLPNIVWLWISVLAETICNLVFGFFQETAMPVQYIKNTFDLFRQIISNTSSLNSVFTAATNAIQR
eukprot:gene1022-7921_t